MAHQPTLVPSLLAQLALGAGLLTAPAHAQERADEPAQPLAAALASAAPASESARAPTAVSTSETSSASALTSASAAPDAAAPAVTTETSAADAHPLTTERPTARRANAGSSLAPAAVTSLTSSLGTRARVRFTSNREGATVYRVQNGEEWMALGGIPLHAYEPLCTAPCERTLEPGRLTFAVSTGARPQGHATFDLEGDHSVRVQTIDHSGSRAAGWVLILSGLAASGALLGASLGVDQASDEALIFGVASGVVLWDSLVSGFILAALNDQTVLRFD